MSHDLVVRAVIDSARASLGPRLVCVAAIGSLAHGGFSAISDIDLAVIAESDGAWLDAARAAAHAAVPAEAKRLSIFWGDRHLAGGRFPPIDRVDLIDHGVALYGALPADLPRPSRDAVRAQLRDSSIPYWGRNTAHFSAHAPLGQDKELARCLLYPARLAFTWRSGRVGSNDEAVAELVTSAPATIEREPITSALAFRRGALGFEALLAFRPRLIPQYQETLRWLDLRVPLPAAS